MAHNTLEFEPEPIRSLMVSDDNDTDYGDDKVKPVKCISKNIFGQIQSYFGEQIHFTKLLLLFIHSFRFVSSQNSFIMQRQYEKVLRVHTSFFLCHSFWLHFHDLLITFSEIHHFWFYIWVLENLRRLFCWCALVVSIQLQGEM